MVALAILVVSLAILVETQGTSAIITREAEAIILASDLAQAKMNEALLVIEQIPPSKAVAKALKTT